MVNSRAKGIRGELRVAKLYQGIYPDARRNYQGRGQRVDGPDIAGLPEWLQVEVKNYKRVHWADLVAWTAGNSHRDGLHICATHVRSTENSLVVLTEETWLRAVELLAKADQKTV
jgi:hypothetical protein